MKIQGIFNVFGHVARGLTSELTRLEAVSENVSNANQVAGEGEPIYHRKTVHPQPYKELFRSMLKSRRLDLKRSDSGHLRGIRERMQWQGEAWPKAKTIESPNEKTIYDPSHPKANAQGYIRMPDVNVVEEMMDMITATRSYEANSSVLNAAKQLARKTLDL